MPKTTKTKQGVLAASLVCCSKLLFAASPIVIPEVSLNPVLQNKTKSSVIPQLTSISRNQIARSPTTTLTGLLKQQQSVVRLTNNSGDNSQVAMSIRGFGDNAVSNSLILIDGFPLLNPSLLAPSINSIALTDIEHIEIFQGSQGTLWGDQAVGGVVNIKTRHPEKTLLEAEGGFGSYGKQFLSMYAAHKTQNGIFLKGFGFSNATNNYRDHNHELDRNLVLLAGFDDARGTTFLSAQKYENTIDLPGGLTAAQYAANPQQASNTVNFSHFITEEYRFMNQRELSHDALLETRLLHHETRGNGFINYVFKRTDQVDSFSPRLTVHFHQQKIITGYEGVLTHFEFDSTKVHDRVAAMQNNLFLEDTIPLLEQFQLKLGGRVAAQENQISQSVDKTNSVFVTEEEISWHPDAVWNYFLRRDGNFRFAKANEETWVAPGVNELHTQTGVSYEGGVARIADNQQTRVTLYQLQLTHEIAFNPVDTLDSPIGVYANFPRTVRRGVTLAENINLTQKLTLNGQVNFVDPRFTEGVYSGNVIPAVPFLNGNAGLDYEFISHLHLNYNALYNGAAYASQDVQNAGKKVSGYWLHDIALQWIEKNYNINFEVVNALNQRYSTYTLYTSSTQAETFYPGAGRSYLLTFKLNMD